MVRYSPLLLICVSAVSAQTKKILVQGDEAFVRELQSVSLQARIVRVTPSTVMREIGDAEAFIGNITPAEVRAGKSLKWVQVMSAGVENVLFMSGSTELRDSDIVLTNNKIVQGPEIADHAMAMLLTLARDLRRYIADDQRETWDGDRYRGIELNGKSAVVIGLGGIGMQIATRAWA